MAILRIPGNSRTGIPGGLDTNGVRGSLWGDVILIVPVVLKGTFHTKSQSSLGLDARGVSLYSVQK